MDTSFISKVNDKNISINQKEVRFLTHAMASFQFLNCGLVLLNVASIPFQASPKERNFSVPCFSLCDP